MVSVKKEGNVPLNNKNESSIEVKDISAVIVSKIGQNKERRINTEFRKEIEEVIGNCLLVIGNCLSNMAINLAQLVIHK